MDVEVVPAALCLKLVEDESDGDVATVPVGVQDPAAHAVLGVERATALVNDTFLQVQAEREGENKIYQKWWNAKVKVNQTKVSLFQGKRDPKLAKVWKKQD